MGIPASTPSASDDDFSALLELGPEADCEEEEEDCTRVEEWSGMKTAPTSRESSRGVVGECDNRFEKRAKHNANFIRCGEASETAQAVVALRYIHQGLKVTKSEAARLRSDKLGKFDRPQKLILVLDLDHTLLNSAEFVKVLAEEEAYCTSAYAVEESSGWGTSKVSGHLRRLHNSDVSLHKLVDLRTWTKLRPFVHGFLEEASKYFEMYVYTMGERKLATTWSKPSV